MNISGDMVVLAGGVLFSVGGFIVSAAILYRGNKNSFKSLKEHFDSGIEMLKLEIKNNMVVSGLERDSIREDIKDLDKSACGIKDQLKSEIYPRLNSVEKLSEKNCKILEYQMKECDRRHKTV